MIMRLLAVTCALTLPMFAATDQPSVHIQLPQLGGSRPLEKQTETSVIKDYLQSWTALESALDQNKASLLDAYFVGTARGKLGNTIDEQMRLAIHTRYVEHAHDLQIVFYSPEGLSIQMIDTVDYDEQVLDHDKILATKRMKKRYLVVLTPAEVRWRVRILQAEGNAAL
jgi:hypothetical protein